MQRRVKRTALVLALIVWTVAAATVAADLTALDEYVARDPWDEPVYRIVGTRTQDGFRLLQIEFVSQTWQNIPWSHRLLLVVPPEVVPAQAAVLYISGSGSGNDEIQAMREVAAATRMPAAALMDIPNQPLFDNLREDALIAYTFQKFVEGEGADWLLLFPMAKGAVRALDVLQAVAAKELGIQIDHFVVAGASKRGWTTWLTGAVDERVIAIVPIVYNNLNLAAQIELHRRTYAEGASPMIHDYTDLGLLELIESPHGAELVAHVDPYAYLERYTMPKMLLHGTNDPYWPVDALNLYWDDLPGEKYVVNFANGGHDLGDLAKAVRSIAAFALHVTGQPLFREVEWTLTEKEDGLPSLEVKRTDGVVGAAYYVAISPSRDFTGAQWLRLEPTQTETGWVVEPMRAAGRYVAFYIDVEYAVRPDVTVALSTPIFVLEPR
jgi:PhoPQ-activated pathogenicity-related protein